MDASSVKSHFLEAHKTLESFMSNENNFELIFNAANAIVRSFQLGGKIISAGNGGSHCDAMHFAEELTGRYKNNRKALPAIAISDASHLSCVGNDYGYEFVFSRYLEALGNNGDIFLGISTSGNSKNIINALEVAKSKGMFVIGLTGKDGGKIGPMCDIEIRAPHSEFADRAQEIHIKVIHALIDTIEKLMELA
jgi:D-sedoheptulose 7-phosphate isomerase